MKPIQIILVGVALVFAVTAGFLAMNMASEPDAPPAQVAQAPIVQTTKVLAAREPLTIGTVLTADNIHWVEWPESGLNPEFISKRSAAASAVAADGTVDATTGTGDPMETVLGAVARTSFYAGEPIRETKLVRSASGYMSAILPAGKRAMAISVAAVRSAGGFILPNDHVDVLMPFRVSREGNRDEATWKTEVVLENVRVLAIDQVIQEEDGQKSKVGETATIEVTPEQAKVLAVANSMAQGNLTLALRSVADNGEDQTRSAAHLLPGADRRKSGTIRIIRFGKTTEVKPGD